ncbi:MAG TPA: hypothetical protein VF192_01470 [Longimicrobiales bacterium]
MKVWTTERYWRCGWCRWVFSRHVTRCENPACGIGVYDGGGHG